MQYQDTIILNEDELYPTCGICFEKFDIDNSQDLNNKTPILLDCGHTFCYSCCTNIQNTIHYNYRTHQLAQKCSWCQKDYYIESCEKSKNLQLLEFFRKFNPKCFVCKETMNSENLPYFKKRQTGQRFFDHTDNVQIYKNNKNSLAQRMRLKKINKTNQSHHLICQRCIGANNTSYQKNYIFDQILTYFEKYTCKKQKCIKVYNLQLKYICFCFVDQLNKNEKLISILDFNNLQKILADDFYCLTNIKLLQEKKFQQLSKLLRVSQTQLINYSQTKIYNDLIFACNQKQQKLSQEQLDDLAHQTSITIQKYIAVLFSQFFEQYFQKQYNEKQSQQNITLEKFVQQCLQQQIRYNIALNDKIWQLKKLLNDFGNDIQNIQDEHFFQNTNINYMRVADILISLWQKKFNNFKEEILACIEVSLICTESIDKEKFQNYHDFIKQQFTQYAVYEPQSGKIQIFEMSQEEKIQNNFTFVINFIN